MYKCPKCEAEILVEANFCMQCGEKVDIKAQVVPEELKEVADHGFDHTKGVNPIEIH